MMRESLCGHQAAASLITPVDPCRTCNPRSLLALAAVHARERPPLLPAEALRALRSRLVLRGSRKGKAIALGREATTRVGTPAGTVDRVSARCCAVSPLCVRLCSVYFQRILAGQTGYSWQRRGQAGQPAVPGCGRGCPGAAGICLPVKLASASESVLSLNKSLQSPSVHSPHLHPGVDAFSSFINARGQSLCLFYHESAGVHRQLQRRSGPLCCYLLGIPAVTLLLKAFTTCSSFSASLLTFLFRNGRVTFRMKS